MKCGFSGVFFLDIFIIMFKCVSDGFLYQKLIRMTQKKIFFLKNFNCDFFFEINYCKRAKIIFLHSTDWKKKHFLCNNYLKNVCLAKKLYKKTRRSSHCWWDAHTAFAICGCQRHTNENQQTIDHQPLWESPQTKLKVEKWNHERPEFLTPPNIRRRGQWPHQRMGAPKMGGSYHYQIDIGDHQSQAPTIIKLILFISKPGGRGMLIIICCVIGDGNFLLLFKFLGLGMHILLVYWLYFSNLFKLLQNLA